MDFCASALGATRYYSHERAEEIKIDARFDLIVSVSLLTHLDASKWAGFLSLFASLLTPDGVLFVTTHGEAVANAMQKGTPTYGLDEETRARIVRSYQREGFGYADYPGSSAYGISLSSPAWVRRWIQHSGLTIQSSTEGAEEGAHDRFACVAT